MSFRSISLIILFLSHGLLGFAVERSPDQIREMVKAAISIRHPEDSPDWWRSLGSLAPKTIIDMYQASSSTVERMKLIRGLSHFRDDSEAMEFVKREAELTDQEVIRYEVLQGIAQSSADKEYEFAAKFLNSSDPHERKFAGMVLVRATMNEKSKARAQELLKKFQTQEKQPWVLKSLDQYRASLDQKEMIQRSPKFKDAVDSAWNGVWSGHYVAIVPNKKTKSFEAEVDFTWPSPERLDANLRWSNESGKKENVSVSGFRGGGMKLFHGKADAVWEWTIRRLSHGSLILRADGPDGVYVFTPRLDTPKQ